MQLAPWLNFEDGSEFEVGGREESMNIQPALERQKESQGSSSEDPRREECRVVKSQTMEATLSHAFGIEDNSVMAVI